MKEPIKIEDYEKGVMIYERGDTVFVDMAYPRINTIHFVGVGVEDVRASDGIRIGYDFERDGYVIEQPTKLEWDAHDEKCDPLWKEVAFIKSWALEADQEKNKVS